MIQADPMATAIYDAAIAPTSPELPTANVPGGPSQAGPQVLIVEEGAPGPQEAFLALRRSRLRAAAAFLAALMSLFAALFLVGGQAVGLLHGGAAVGLWSVFAWLSSRRP